MINLTMKLFNAVEAKQKLGIVVDTDTGVVIDREAAWAQKDILSYLNKETLNGNDLNKTFHKSWSTIKNSSREELFVHQIFHYLSTYGSGFQDEIYIPDEVLDVPVNLKFKVIKAYPKHEFISKCLDLLKSGIALKEETIDDVLNLLDYFEYTFTGDEGVKNKEAIIKIADKYQVFPKDPVEFLRYVIYRTTGETLLIKNKELTDKIVQARYNPSHLFKKFGLEKLAQIFNRFKPLFLAYKGECPRTINKISKLSKTHHKPMNENPLNQVTQRLLTNEDNIFIERATIYALFKALAACHTRMNGQEEFIYRIRNGKSWAQSTLTNKDVCEKNYSYLLKYLKKNFNTNKTVLFPKDVEYALPTSEKLFVGNIPTGTKFFGKRLAAGVYWENSWGARDIDLSGQNISGKIGWDSTYNMDDELLYSGDITNAPQGAVEYLYGKGSIPPTLVMSNVYFGENDCGYKIVVGKGDKVSKDYMMNPNEVFAEIKCQSVQEQTVIGMLMDEGKKNSFTLLNFGAGHARVSGRTETANTATRALYQQYKNPLTLKEVCASLGFKEVKENPDVDLSLDSLTKTTFIDLFDKKSS